MLDTMIVLSNALVRDSVYILGSTLILVTLLSGGSALILDKEAMSVS